MNVEARAALWAGSRALAARAAVLAAITRPWTRGLVRFLVWALVLRWMARVVGVWTGGRLGLAPTLFVGVLVPAWLVVLSPTWLAWRGPAATRALVGAASWLSPLVLSQDLAGIRVFAATVRDRPRSTPRPADAWTALAAALEATRHRDLARADRIGEALGHLPPGARFPWLARVHGVEPLVWAAVERGDWAAAERWAELGRGRLIALLALLARAAAGDPVPAERLWLAWAFAPARRRTWPLVRRLAAPSTGPLIATPAPGAPVRATTTDPRLRHLFLLASAARGEALAMRDVLALAAAWDAQLDAAALARVQARALELEVRDAAVETRQLRARVLDELAALAADAHGTLPDVQDSQESITGTLEAELVRLTRERLYARVAAALTTLAPERAGATPLEIWERWLLVRAELERLEQQAGAAAVASVWHAGVRDTVWNATCVLFNGAPEQTAWVGQAIFTWLADRAEYLQDHPTALVNRENARAALRAMS